MDIERVTEVNAEIAEAVAALLPQLSRTAPVPTREALAEVARTQTLLVARDGSGRIVGTLTLVVYRIPTGLDARIEDVVVDASAGGQGVGEALTLEAIERARAVAGWTVQGARRLAMA